MNEQTDCITNLPKAVISSWHCFFNPVKVHRLCCYLRSFFFCYSFYSLCMLFFYTKAFSQVSTSTPGVSASAMIQLPPPGVVVVLIDKKFSVWNRVYKRQHPIQVRVHGREHVYQHMYIRLISFENRSIDTNFIKQDIYPKSIFQRFWIFLSLGTAHQPKRYSDWIWLCEIATFYDINLRPCFVLGFSPVFSPLLCTSFNSKYQSCTVINKDRLAINHEWNDKKQQ